MSDRQGLDRRMWADIQRIGFDLVARGHGEHLMEEPIYFGRAFTDAPVFNYSVTTDVKDDPVTPMVFVPPRDLLGVTPDTDGLYPHSMAANYMWQDPSFEVQGQWVNYGLTGAEVIPDVHCYRYNDSYSQVILDAWVAGLPHADGYRQPYYSNSWVQTSDTRQRWVVTDEKSHDLGWGFPGKYSAKYVFDSGSSSNWLIGLENYESSYGRFAYLPVEADDEWAWYTTDAWPTRANSLYPSGHIYAEPPPVWAGWKGFVHVWSDADCEVEVWSGALNVDGVGEEVAAGNVWLTDQNSSTQMVRGGEWTRVDFFNAYEDESGEYPNIPPDHFNEIGTFFWQQRIRINGGVPGQVAYLDNCYVWPDLRNFTTPMVTIGVYEWVKDEYGAYIGARLWFKAGVL